MTNRCKKKLSNSLASREMQMKIMRHCFASVRRKYNFNDSHTLGKMCALVYHGWPCNVQRKPRLPSA